MRKISMSNSENLTVDEAFQLYIKKCTVRNLSEKTIQGYNVAYCVFERFIDGSSLIKSINNGTIDKFIFYLREHNRCNDITINYYLRTIRAFLYFCMNNGYVDKFAIHMIKVNKPIKETYTDEELKILLKKPDLNKCDFKEFQMWVYSNYLLATGNRISSALNLKIKDLDFDNQLIYIRKTKNRKSQIIPMSKTLAGILQEYLIYRGGEPEDYVFCTITGEKATIRCYQDALKHYNYSRGIMKASSHLYRHTYAKNWILNGGDIFRLQKILGHSDLTVVKEYVNMFSKDLAVDFDKFNPLDNLGINQPKKRITLKD